MRETAHASVGGTYFFLESGTKVVFLNGFRRFDSSLESEMSGTSQIRVVVDIVDKLIG